MSLLRGFCGSLLRINRNIVECKYSKPLVSFITHHLELIETLWNVNRTQDLLDFIIKFELIETLWNVNSKVFDKEIGQNMN